MPFVAAAVLVAVVHLATGLTAWLDVGLLADDHEMIGAAVLRHRGDWTLASAFLPPAAPADPVRALYRPVVDLLFWLEQPWFGVDAFGYHVVNSVLHCGTALLWFVLVRRWSGSLAAALATSVLFAGWPGHSEATHWIAARTNLLSTFLMSAALCVHDRALTATTAAGRGALLGAGSLCAVLAIGAKESAVFVVPLAAVVAACRSPSLGIAARRAAPLAVAAALWLWWRASRIGTWGSGSHYGWRFERVGADSSLEWLAVLFAPVHRVHLPAWTVAVLAVLHLVLLAVAIPALRRAGARRVAAVGAALLALGYAAGVGLETLHADVLQNVRYSYEPALGLCALLGIGVAALPSAARGPALAGLVAVHAVVLEHNRRSWLDAAAVYDRMQGDVLTLARTTGAPVRVFDAPGVYDGAFAYLNGHTEFLFWQGTAPPGTELRGAVSSTEEWRPVLAELAAAAAARRPAPAHVVQWSDGALAPFVLDTQWPAAPFEGVEVLYARVARARPFAGSTVPVHVLVRTAAPVRLVVGDAAVAVAPAAEPQAVALDVALPVGAVDEPVAFELRVERGAATVRYALGSITPVRRR